MTNFYYFDQANQKQGPVSEQQLKELATQGVITPDTPMETDTGHQGTAGQIPGIFPPNPFAASPFASPPAVAPVDTRTIIAKKVCCNGCGATLEIPKNAKGHVQCTSCGNECVLDGIIKNAEIAAKENIQSGIPLTATPATLHRQLVSLLSESPYIPLDVFDKLEIISEERHCVPAYQFYCSGTASFTYQVGRREIRQEQGYKKGILDDETYHTIKTIEEIKWTPMSSSAAVTETVYAPASKKLADPIQKLYAQLDAKKLTSQLVEIEELGFPADVETHPCNLPKPAALDEYAKPRVEAILEKNAKKSLGGYDYLKDFTMGGGNLQNEAVRVFLGLYHVVYKYGGKEYSMWATGDGKNGWLENPPVDSSRKSVYDNTKSVASASKQKIVPTLWWFRIEDDDTTSGIGGWSWYVYGNLYLYYILSPFVIPLVLALIIHSTIKKVSSHNKEIDEARTTLQALEAPRLEAVRRFRNAKKACAGIYAEKISGDAGAF